MKEAETTAIVTPHFLDASTNREARVCSAQERRKLLALLERNQDFFTKVNGDISLDNFNGLKTLLLQRFSAHCTHSVMEEFLQSYSTLDKPSVP